MRLTVFEDLRNKKNARIKQPRPLIVFQSDYLFLSSLFGLLLLIISKLIIMLGLTKFGLGFSEENEV